MVRKAVVGGVSRVVFAGLELVAKLPFSHVLLLALPREAEVRIDLPRGRLARALQTFVRHFFKHVAGYSRRSRSIPAAAWFSLRGERFRMILDVNEYTQCAYYFGEADDALLTLLRRGGRTFVDVGANVGLYSIAASLFFDRVVAFEPARRTRPLLERNIRESKRPNVRVFPYALSSQPGRVEFVVDPVNQGGNFVLAPPDDGGAPVTAEEHQPSYTVECTTLDELVERQGIEGIDLIKVDVEGHEEAVFRGAVDTLRRFRPTLFVEVGSREKLESLLALLPEGYAARHPSEGFEVSDPEEWALTDVVFAPRAAG